MSKNVVIFCDGTANEVATDSTNVFRMLDAAVKDPRRQMVFYQPGLGTAGTRDWQPLVERVRDQAKSMIGLFAGYGLYTNIANCYKFLMETFETGDQIFIFGFSRGAYTARALAGFIHMFGIFERGNDVSVDYAIELFKDPKKQKAWSLAPKLNKALGRKTKIAFLGLWDSVNSVGTAAWTTTLPNTRKNPDVLKIRHALAIDERRKFFVPDVYGADSGCPDIKQVWFAGGHSDVGGGIFEVEGGLSKISLNWMASEAKAAGLYVDQQRLDRLTGLSGSDGKYSKADPNAALHELILDLKFKVLEFVPRNRFDPKVGDYRWHLKGWQRRAITRSELVHSSVGQRTNYAPPNLPPGMRIEP